MPGGSGAAPPSTLEAHVEPALARSLDQRLEPRQAGLRRELGRRRRRAGARRAARRISVSASRPVVLDGGQRGAAPAACRRRRPRAARPRPAPPSRSGRWPPASCSSVGDAHALVLDGASARARRGRARPARAFSRSSAWSSARLRSARPASTGRPNRKTSQKTSPPVESDLDHRASAIEARRSAPPALARMRAPRPHSGRPSRGAAARATNGVVLFFVRKPSRNAWSDRRARRR